MPAETSCTDAAPVFPADDDARYLALKARDARFDGHFFTGVRSTGIYCRPVCKVLTPKRENCRFFALAAQAEQAGFRPCLRCRPELAPTGVMAVWSTQDASAVLAQQAARLLDRLPGAQFPAGQGAAPSDGAPVGAVAERLGISDRHLRRIFEAQWGISPLQYLQTRRLLTAKQLLTDTLLPMTQVAALSGFSSLRRFNDAFQRQYRLQPRALRRPPVAHAGKRAPVQAQLPALDCIVLRASYRPPYAIEAMLGFLQQRCIAGVEWVDPGAGLWRRVLQIPGSPRPLRGWIEAQFDRTQSVVAFRVSHSLHPVLPEVLRRLRAALDLDADPLAIEARLGPYFPGQAGSRVPGTVDGFELAVRAILGQQVTVAAARTFATRLAAFGTPVATPWPALTHSFPDAAALAALDADTLGGMGIVRQRQVALHAVARAVMQETLSLDPGAPVETTLAALQQLPGIGPWTAHYIAMRALRWPDAFPSGDVALQKALGVRDLPRPAQAAEAASQAWRPWRSYAVLRAWNQAPTPSPPAPATESPPKE